MAKKPPYTHSFNPFIIAHIVVYLHQKLYHFEVLDGMAQEFALGSFNAIAFEGVSKEFGSHSPRDFRCTL